ncbi:MAG: sodium/proline symporter, partial [Butyricicoccus sp.]
ISYTFAGGFFAVCWTDFFQGLLMFFCVLAVPTIAIQSMGGYSSFIGNVEAFNPNFLSMFVDGATNEPYTAIGIISLLAWGLGYFGQPHILIRFMGIESPAAIKKSRRIATIWVVISLTAAVMIGVSGRMFLGDSLLNIAGQEETIYISMVAKIFPVFIGGIFLSAILAAIMSTADSQLLVTASAITEDFYHNKIRPNASPSELMWVSRICVMVVALIAVFIATNQNSTVLGLVSYAWAGFGAAFGPLVLLSLFWKRANKYGAYAGIIVGGLTSIIWAQLSGGIFDLYEIVPGFCFGLIAIVVVSLLTPAPDAEIEAEFDSYNTCED